MLRRASVRPSVRPVGAISYKPMNGISPKSVDDVVEATGELVWL